MQKHTKMNMRQNCGSRNKSMWAKVFTVADYFYFLYKEFFLEMNYFALQLLLRIKLSLPVYL
jgi:hypothetical protein